MDEKENSPIFRTLKLSFTDHAKMTTPKMKSSQGKISSPFDIQGNLKKNNFKIYEEADAPAKKTGKSTKRNGLSTLQQSASGNKGELTRIATKSLKPSKDEFFKKKAPTSTKNLPSTPEKSPVKSPAKKRITDLGNIVDETGDCELQWNDDEQQKVDITLVQRDEAAEGTTTENSCDFEEANEDVDVLAADAIALMKQTEAVGDSYWKQIAEERRLALEEVLSENDKLFDEVDKLTSENEQLKKQAGEATYYKLLYTNLLQETSDSDAAVQH